MAMNQYDEDKAKKTNYKFPGQEMEMSWEFNPKMARPENSTLLTDIKHHQSHGDMEIDKAEERHRQRH
jgi:hypothetical protein